jgi:hypothetical protein
VFYANISNISIISCLSVLLVEENRLFRENHIIGLICTVRGCFRVIFYRPSNPSCFCAACLSVSKANYTPTRREGAILQSPCPFVRPFTLSLKMSHLLLEEMILFLIHDFGIVTCTMSPLSRLTTHLLPVYRATYNFSCLP